ncbi:MAG TPA: hypothetical protein VKU87_08155, partial [Thermomicrobiaceae bacterium]|nr:hypothetical protein [Thermomicrobiaceae bacterium]
MRITPETAFLEGIEPFLHSDLDRPEYAAMLDLLGVRTDPRSDLPLRRLRDLSQANPPPISGVVKLYETLDRLASRYSAEELATLRQAFQDEPLVFASNQTWQPASAVAQRDDLGIPGIMTLYPEIAALHLTLWDRIGMHEQATPNHVINWLSHLETGKRIEDKTAQAIKEALAASPREIWQRCRAWLDLTGYWRDASDLRWWAASSDAAQGLFTNIRQQVADGRMLRHGSITNPFQPELRQLDLVLDPRVTAANRTGSGTEPDWKRPLARGLLHLGTRSAGPVPNQVEDVEKRPDHEPAMRLLLSSWQPAQSIEIQPYLDGTPAGESRQRKVLWRDNEILVTGRAPEYHDELVKALVAPFALPASRDAITACIGRSPSWIRDYLRENLGVEIDLKEPSDDELVIALPASMSPNGHLAGSQREPLTNPARVVTLLGEEPDTEAIDKAEESEDPDEVLGGNAPKRRQELSRRAFLLNYFQQQGFEPSTDSTLRHPDGRTAALFNGTRFSAVVRDGRGRPMRYLWLGEGSLLEGFEIGAEAWDLLRRHAAMSSVM